MRFFSVFTMILGIALVLASVLSLDVVVYMDQVVILAQMTIVGVCCSGFGASLLVQRVIIEKALGKENWE